ncbi:MAG: hypothetical protein MUE81_14680 [Thermoflexibacter sp.]|jgi:hypothetical protein|nr:hypothetical protein [Thermoflexibacter sp.]
MINKILRNLFLLFATILYIIGDAFGQGSDPIPPGEIPLDGGILGLLVAGALYGAKKIYDQKKKD